MLLRTQEVPNAARNLVFGSANLVLLCALYLTLDKSLTGQHSAWWLLCVKARTPGGLIDCIFPLVTFPWHTQAGGALRGCIYPEIGFLYSPTHYYFASTREAGNTHRVSALQLLEMCGLICILRTEHIFWSYSVWVKASLKVGSVFH